MTINNDWIDRAAKAASEAGLARDPNSPADGAAKGEGKPDGEQPSADPDSAPTVLEDGQSWRDTDEDPWGTAEDAPPHVIGQ